MTDVDQRMTMQAAHPAASPGQLAWLFLRSVLVAGVFASALYAGIYVARDMRRGATPPAAGPDVRAPAGLELLTRVSSAGELASLTGFAPVLPDALPTGTVPAPRLDATQPAADGGRTAEIRFTAARDAAGLPAGPSILLRERRRSDGDGAVAPRVVAPATVQAMLVCGDVTVEARLYFPTTTDDASALDGSAKFIDRLSRSCGA